MRRGVAIAVVMVLLALVAGCGQIPATAPTPGATPTGAAPTGAPNPPETSQEPSTRPRSIPPASPIPTASATPAPTCPGSVPAAWSLRGERGRAFAFAPLSDQGRVTVEGEVDGSEAWSTSKVLVVAAFLQTTADGDPEALSVADRRLITAALTRSDGDATAALRRQIPGSPGRAMTGVLREIGDERTTAPDAYEGLMPWSLREQVRFMAALDAGAVVSAEASAYLLATMHPIRQHRWGLGARGATAFKGGWLREGRVTRQLGLLDGYAVAIITDRGPVVRQTDGDSAHVAAMDDLAGVLARRLAYDRRCG